MMLPDTGVRNGLHPGVGSRWSISKFLVTAATVSVMLVLACGGGVTTAQPGQSTVAKEADGVMAESVNRIAYVSPDGELFTINPDGSGSVQLTGAIQAEQRPQGGPLAQPLASSELYAWPTWSPDGTKLAASRVVLRDGAVEMTLQVIDVLTSTFTTVHRNEVPALVAEGAPHYIYWAPDSRTLTFLAGGNGGITMFVWDSISGADPVPIETNAPLYFNWASDSGSMVMHAGPEVKVRNFPVGEAPETIVPDARGFRVPAFSPDGSQVAYVEDTADGGTLFVAPIDDLAAGRRIMDVGAMSAFLWSPDGSQLAVADHGTVGTPLFERLVLVPAVGGEPTVLASEQMMAFFWAPTGERLAWVAVDAQQRHLEWVVTAVSGGEERRLLRFSPSVEVLTMLSFFDQYVYSNSPWSPDGASLVVAGTREQSTDRRNGGSPSGARIYVLDAVGGGEPREIAAGKVASWSWN